MTCELTSRAVLPVRGEDDGASLFDDAEDGVPERPPGLGVHPCRRLVLWPHNNYITHTAPPGGTQLHYPHRTTRMYTTTLPTLHHQDVHNYITHTAPPGCTCALHTCKCVCACVLPTRKTTGGPPIRAMAVDSFLMFPPL